MSDKAVANEPQLSPREQQLLQELSAIKSSCQRLSRALDERDLRLQQQERELSATRRSMIELKEENSHLREVLQTWRSRMDSVLSQLRSLD